ncbi:hypothetical protein A6A03_17645 [Chloroflexus islandicus]|uniref:DUF5666 domain-containing protein n=1 Tax=Chloroflexus islandicus TaxID=1707952 RepID=A0A178M513_9CHLR|nr:hypothetical protein [Chloroflexus islandicus]OAN43849.1 hypothetical protein A6A03_17645 [Chloroflexus islandicus]
MLNLLIMLSIAVLGALAWSPGATYAQPGQSDTPVTMTGTVTAFKSAPRGEIDGFYLDNGTEVRFPKHWGGAVTQAVAVGAPVRVEGRQHIGRRGDTHVKAQVIVNLNTNARVVIEEAVDISGRITNYTYSRSGRIDGFIMSTGDEVRTPPHLAATIANTLPVGASVRVVGVRKTGKYGEVQIKPDTITNLDTGTVLVIP